MLDQELQNEIVVGGHSFLSYNNVLLKVAYAIIAAKYKQRHQRTFLAGHYNPPGFVLSGHLGPTSP
jgi:hypothetical protein